MKRSDIINKWKEVKYKIFDAPSVKAPVEERFDHIREVVGKMGVDHVEVVEMKKCKGSDHLKEQLEVRTRKNLKI